MATDRVQLTPPSEGFISIEKIGPVQVLVMQEGSHLVAQCLQYDFAVQGHSVPDLQQRLVHAFATQILIDNTKGREPLKTTPPAPARYFGMWDDAARLSPKFDDKMAEAPVVREAQLVVRRANFAMA